MKTKVCLGTAVALALLSSAAMAQTATSSSNSGSTSSSSADAAAQAAAAAIARGGSAHNQSSFRSPRAPGAIGLPGLAASGGCMGSTSIGASFIGGGIGLGSSWQDQRCNAREDARLLAAFGYREQAMQLLINNSPMIAQVMVPGAPGGKVVSLREEPGYRPVSLETSDHYVNGIRQVFRGGGSGVSEKCRSVLGLIQQQDDYLKGLLASKAKLSNKKDNARLVQENLRQGSENVLAVCPPSMVPSINAEISGRSNQIDQFLATGRWVGPVG